MCLFHLRQALRKNMQSLGVTKQAGMIESEAEIYEELFAALGSLQFVEPSIVSQSRTIFEKYFESAISNRMFGNQGNPPQRRKFAKNIVTKTLNYFYGQWIDKHAIFSFFSLYDLKTNFTNNYSESNNNVLRIQMNGSKLTLPSYLQSIQYVIFTDFYVFFYI